MKRGVIGIIVGFLMWTALWIGGNAMLSGDAVRAVEEGREITNLRPL